MHTRPRSSASTDLSNGASFFLLEDNVPTCYKCGLAAAAKRDLGIEVLGIPKRSPDLNPLDYAFWSEVNSRLRKQESKFASDFKEARRAFVARLRRTILRIPPATLANMVGNMKRRCELLKLANGAHFEEGA